MKNWKFCWGFTLENFLSLKSILLLTPLCSYFGKWKIYLLVSDFTKNSIMSTIWMIIPFCIKLGILKNRSRSSSFFTNSTKRSKHRSDPFKSTPEIKYFSKNSFLDGLLKVCISHDLWKKYSIFTIMFLFKSLKYVLFQMICLLSKVLQKSYTIKPKKLYLL